MIPKLLSGSILLVALIVLRYDDALPFMVLHATCSDRGSFLSFSLSFSLSRFNSPYSRDITARRLIEPNSSARSTFANDTR